MKRFGASSVSTLDGQEDVCVNQESPYRTSAAQHSRTLIEEENLNYGPVVQAPDAGSAHVPGAGPAPSQGSAGGVADDAGVGIPPAAPCDLEGCTQPAKLYDATGEWCAEHLPPQSPRGGSTRRLSVIGTCRVVGCSDDGHPGYHHPGPPQGSSDLEVRSTHIDMFTVEIWHLGAHEPVEGRVDFVTHVDGRTHLVVTLDD